MNSIICLNSLHWSNAWTFMYVFFIPGNGRWETHGRFPAGEHRWWTEAKPPAVQDEVTGRQTPDLWPDPPPQRTHRLRLRSQVHVTLLRVQLCSTTRSPGVHDHLQIHPPASLVGQLFSWGGAASPGEEAGETSWRPADQMDEYVDGHRQLPQHSLKVTWTSLISPNRTCSWDTMINWYMLHKHKIYNLANINIYSI